jgi:hypothetical protein
LIRLDAVRATHSQILREARIEQRVAAALRAIDLPLPAELHRTIGDALYEQPEASWRDAIERLADQLAASQHDADPSPKSRP